MHIFASRRVFDHLWLADSLFSAALFADYQPWQRQHRRSVFQIAHMHTHTDRRLLKLPEAWWVTSHASKSAVDWECTEFQSKGVQAPADPNTQSGAAAGEAAWIYKKYSKRTGITFTESDWERDIERKRERNIDLLIQLENKQHAYCIILFAHRS